MESTPKRESRVVGVRLLKWDEYHYGVAIDYADGEHDAYCVGTWDQATAEAAAVRGRN